MMGWVFWTRFGHGRTLGKDDCQSFWMAIWFMKKNKKNTLTAVDGHLSMKRHTTTNQSTVSMMGGDCVMRFDCGGTCGGAIYVVWGGEWGNKKFKKKISLWPSAANGWRFNTTTDQNTQAWWMEYHTRRETWQGCERSAISSILGQSSWEEVKKWNKIDECTN